MTITATPSATERTLTGTAPWRSQLQTYGIVIVLAALIAIITAIQPAFLDGGNIANILSQWAPIGIMAIGMTFVVITGGFDLSVGAIYALSGITAAAIGATQAPIVAFTAAVTVGIAAGLINGAIITVLQVNPFIATLGTSFIFGGVGLVLTNNQPFVVDFPPFAVLGSGRLAGIPYSGMLLVFLMVAGGVILAYSAYGQSIYAIGGNLEASRLAGLRVTWTAISAYVISGACAALGGIVATSQLSYAQATVNSDIVFNVLTIVVVGGTSLTGGIGTMWRTAVGLGILAALQNGFNLLHVNPYYQGIIKGVIIIAALALDSGVRNHILTPFRRRRSTKTTPVNPLTEGME